MESNKNTQNNQNQKDIIEIGEVKFNSEESEDDFKSPDEEENEKTDLWEQGKISVQQWLEQKYSKEKREEITEIDTRDWNLEEKVLKGKLKFEDFDNLERIIFSKEAIKDIDEIEFIDLPNIEMIGFNLSFRDGEVINGINTIKLKDLPDLKIFLANHCKIEEIEIENCPDLVDFRVGNNLLTKLDFLDKLNPKKLNILSIHSNNLGEREKLTLTRFEDFKNLKSLFIDNVSRRMVGGKSNRFYGSLECLNNLDKLEELNISNTDIEIVSESGELKVESFIDFLNTLESLETISFSTPEWLKNEENLKEVGKEKGWFFEKKEDKCNFSKIKDWKDIHPEFSEDFDKKNEWENKGFRLQQVNEWIKVGLNPQDAEFAGYLSEEEFNAQRWRSPFESVKRNELMKKYNYLEKWKERKSQQWLDKEYPLKEDEGCIGIFDLENKGKKRKDIEELDISGEELEGELDLKGFVKLKYLICRNNKLTEIDLKDCPKLVGIDCTKNELSKLIFSNNESENLNLKEFRGSDNKFSNLKDITDHINTVTLTYLDINNNNISDAEISEFNRFSNLENLYIGNTEEKGGSNRFAGQIEELKNLKKLLEIDIRNNGIEIKDDFLNRLKNDKKILGKLEKIYWIGEYNDFGQYYEGNSYDVKASRQKKSSRTVIRSIVKSPLLSEDKNYKVNRIKDDYSMKKEYYKNSKLIYPSETETGFSWKSGKSLPLSKLPLRLCHINSEIDKIKSQTPQSESSSLSSRTKENIKVKRRIECADDAKHYAILSYSWGGKHKEDIKWSLESAEERLSPGGVKSLDKAIQTLKILNKHHISRMAKGSEIEYLWIDQLCVNQNNDKEKAHEVSRMRDYYNNATVTLIAIHAEVGEENIRKLIKSFEPGESGLIYPNKIIDSASPILEKIMGSEWFSRSWTFQEGFLSKQTIFMFDDFLIDGRFMSLIWKLKQVSKVHYDECKNIKELCREKATTPVGWLYYEDKGERGYKLQDKASLRLNEALWAVKDRGRALPVDGIYSIIGLLPYGDKIKVDYGKDPESVLQEVMLIAMKNSWGEVMAWNGAGSRTLGLCWVPEIDRSGSSSVKGGIKITYEPRETITNEEHFFEPNKGIKVRASEYIITSVEKSDGIYNLEREETVEGGLWMRKVWVKVGNNGEEKLTLSGTKEGIKASSEGRTLLMPNREEWKSKFPFAILALKVDNGDKDKNIRHRIDLVGIEEGYENLISKETESPKNEEKTFIIGLDNQELQAQIEIPPKK